MKRIRLKDYRKIPLFHPDVQAKMSHKSLFVLNGREAAIRSLVSVIIFYFIFRIVFDVIFSPLIIAFCFLTDAALNTFKYKWLGILKKGKSS